VSRSRLTHALDWAALALLVVAVLIAVTGGASLRMGGIRVTARSPERALVAALAIVVLRVVRDRRTRPLETAPAVLRAVRDRLYAPDLDAVPDAPPRRARGLGIATLGICAFAAALLYEQLLHLDFVPDLGDPLFSIWRFSWVYHKLLGDPRPLFSPNIFHPHTLTLTYSDSMLLPSLMTAPFLAIGLHPVVAYNLVMVISFVLSAVAMYALLEPLTGSPRAAFVSALLFGFYPYRFEHYSHFELQMTFCIPLALLALHRFAATGRTWYAMTTGVLAAAQLYCSMYYAVFFTMYAAVVFAVMCVVLRANVKRLIGPAALACLLAGVLAWPLARTYSAAHLGDRDVQTVQYYSATPADYLRAHPRSAMWGDISLPGRQPERALFPGVMVLLLAAAALVPPIGRIRLIYAAGLLTAFVISLGFNTPLYAYLYDGLSFMRGLRVPARCSIFVGFTLALLAGFGARRILANRSGYVSAGLLAALVIAIGVDLHPMLRLEPVWSDPPPIYGKLSGRDNVVLAEFPFGGNPRGYTSNVPFMYFSIWHWAQLVNGYSGHYPLGQLELEVALYKFPDPSSLALLRERGTTHVSVNCALYRGGCDRLLEEVDAVPDLHLVASGRWQSQPVRLYELKR
jgi:hypothetical protein